MALITGIALLGVVVIRSLPDEEHFHTLFVGIWEYRNPSGNVDLEISTNGTVRHFAWVQSVRLDTPDDFEIVFEDGKLIMRPTVITGDLAPIKLVPFYWGPNKLLIYEANVERFCANYDQLETTMDWEVHMQLVFSRLGAWRQTRATPQRYDDASLC